MQPDAAISLDPRGYTSRLPQCPIKAIQKRHRPREEAIMNDMLTAFHLVRHFELLEKERRPCREVVPETGPSLGIRLFRKLRAIRTR